MLSPLLSFLTLSIKFSCVSLIQELFLYPTLRIKIITVYTIGLVSIYTTARMQGLVIDSLGDRICKILQGQVVRLVLIACTVSGDTHNWDWKDRSI